MSDYQHLFKSKTKSQFDNAGLYVNGLIISNLKNIERISEELDQEYYQMQHFITDSKWDYRSVIDKVATEVSESLPKRKLTGLIIDESGWVKKGDKSVGVGRQYCGNVGKLANSQVAVFACLSNGKYASLVDTRLYLPKDWCNDQKRCDEAGIPQTDRKFKTKLELAIEIIEHQKRNNISFDYISADGYYGNDADFDRKIDRMGYVYMLDIHSDQKIFLEKPELYLPERKSKKGPTPKHLKSSINGVTVKEYLQGLKSKDWQTIGVRNSAKGVLKGKYHFKEIFIWDKSTNTIETRMLVIRKTKTSKKGDEIKYSFTNANLVQYEPKGLAYMQCQRFFIEHSFKESKQILGLDHFQTRKWISWHHQVALNFMVSSFMLKEKLLHQSEIPLLSARDIMDFMVYKIYKSLTEEQILDRIFERHKKRFYDIKYSYSKQNMC